MQFRIFNFDSLDSTNSEAEHSKYSNGDVISAEFQKNGRGQRGNVWQSNSAENLLFSVVLEPVGLHITRSFVLSECASLAIVRTLRDFGVVEAEVKWPNDVLIKGRKVAGILIENRLLGAEVSRSIIGVGLNVLQKDFSMVRELPATSMACEGALGGITTGMVLRRFCENFGEYYEALSREEVHSDYLSVMFRREGFHRFRDMIKDEVVMARIVDIEPNMGVMTLELLGSGERREYYFKEVSFLR